MVTRFGRASKAARPVFERVHSCRSASRVLASSSSASGSTAPVRAAASSSRARTSICWPSSASSEVSLPSRYATRVSVGASSSQPFQPR